jgi:hypothetical protein
MTTSEAKEFMLVLRRALLLIVVWIEQHYGLDPHKTR